MRKILIPLLLLSAISSSLAQDWPHWRGPDHDWNMSSKGWSISALHQAPKIKWKVNVGHGHSSFAIKGGRLYTQGETHQTVGDSTHATEQVLCLNAQTGKTIWKVTRPGIKGQYAGPQSTPSIDGNHLYAVTRYGIILCLDAKNSRVHWERDLIADNLSGLHPWGYSASPMIEDDYLFMNGSVRGFALNKKTGKTLWKSTPSPMASAATPLLVNLNGRRTLIMQTSDSLLALEPSSGKVYWSFYFANSNIDPIVKDNKIFLAGGRANHLHNGQIMLQVKNDTPEILWQNKGPDYAFQPWVWHDDGLYGLRRNRTQPLTCLDAETGQLMWEHDFGKWGSVIRSGDKLIMATNDGRLVVGKAQETGWESLADVQIIQMPDNENLERYDHCYLWTSPVIVNGLLYSRNTWGEMVCIDLK
ncbi:PQQ-like beta-propeller repeat protein [bacterium]|nr:PQQ-like beta-propeller repeat protein [bacterium]